MLATRLNARLIDCGGCAQGLRRKQPGLVILQRRHHRGQVVRVLLAHLQPRRALFVCMYVLYRFVQLLFCLLSGFISGFTVYQKSMNLIGRHLTQHYADAHVQSGFVML